MPTIHDPPRGTTPSSPVAGHHPGRATENVDARLGIRHDDEKQEQKKREHTPHDLHVPEDVYDQTTLSVSALIDFLNKFLQGLSSSVSASVKQAPPQASKDSGPSISDTMPASATSSPKAAAAAQAYGRTAHIHADSRVDVVPETTLLNAVEIREIHALLVKLHDLEKNNIQGLTLDRAESFVQSLINAADHALRSLPPKV